MERVYSKTTELQQVMGILITETVPAKLEKKPTVWVPSLSSHSNSVLLLSILASLFSSTLALSNNGRIKAVLMFGDSVVDTGNNNDLISPAKSNFPPYGRNFEGGIPTGRFSNGKVPSDLIVEILGIKELLPPYKDPSLTPRDLLTGVCFASGGAGYDPLTSKISSAISLSAQIQQMKEYVEKLRGIIGEEGTKTLLSKTLVLMLLGSNDIDDSYFGLRIRSMQYTAESYTDILADYASNFVKEVYGLGVRKIGIFSAPPVGCVPATRTTAGGLTRECSDEFNQVVQLFNSKLSQHMEKLNNKLPNSTVLYINVYDPLLNIINNPQNFGFEMANKGCCGTGTIEAAVFCNKYSVETCTDESKYVFWDAYHPTEKAYRILVYGFFPKYLNVFLCGKPAC